MALTSLLFKKTLGQVGVVKLDVVLSETHSKTSEVTQFPVEEGADIADHVRRKPEKIELVGIVTNTPLYILPTFTAPSPIVGDVAASDNRVAAAYDKLREIMDKGEPVTVITTLREYKNMVIESFSVTRDAASGNILQANIGLIEVLKAKLMTTTAPVPKAKTKTKAKPDDKGKKPSKPPEQTTLAKISSKAGALLGW